MHWFLKKFLSWRIFWNKVSPSPLSTSLLFSLVCSASITLYSPLIWTLKSFRKSSSCLSTRRLRLSSRNLLTHFDYLVDLSLVRVEDFGVVLADFHAIHLLKQLYLLRMHNHFRFLLMIEKSHRRHNRGKLVLSMPILSKEKRGS